MSSLTENELRAIAYYSIGVSSEGKDVAYQLSLCGQNTHKPGVLEPIGNSGYAIGEMQTDLGAHKDTARELVDSFQAWAKRNHPDWELNDQQASQLASGLARDGNHIRDPNYDPDNARYQAEHHTRRSIPSSHLHQTGLDIDQTSKSHLDTYLASDAGKTFVHQQDKAQVTVLMDRVATPLQREPLYKNASAGDQAKMFAMVAKVYNQGPDYANQILHGIKHHQINSLDDISKKIDTFVRRDPKHPERPTYMETGRDDALRGAELFNTLRNASERNAMHAPWRAIAADPLIDPAQVAKDLKQPHLADQYATVKGLFVQPEQGRALVDALEQSGSYHYGNPSHAHSRGFYAQGNDFLQWDKNGQGRAFIGGEWSEFSRHELSLHHKKDHSLDLDLTRGGETHGLLHVAGQGHTHSAVHHAHRASVQAITPTEPPYARNDPRHPDNPQHGLFKELKERIPEACENRLLQFTAACHANGITDKNIGRITYFEEQGFMHFETASEIRPSAIVDVKTLSPEPQQSIQNIQQTDQLQAQIHAQFQAQQAQINAQAQQGPVLGGGPMH
jgi:hypothetical protein